MKSSRKPPPSVVSCLIFSVFMPIPVAMARCLLIMFVLSKYQESYPYSEEKSKFMRYCLWPTCSRDEEAKLRQVSGVTDLVPCAISNSFLRVGSHQNLFPLHNYEVAFHAVRSLQSSRLDESGPFLLLSDGKASCGPHAL